MAVRASEVSPELTRARKARDAKAHAPVAFHPRKLPSLPITHFTHLEGGTWFPWEGPMPIWAGRLCKGVMLLWTHEGEAPRQVHALRLAGGMEWDAINGWRQICALPLGAR